MIDINPDIDYDSSSVEEETGIESQASHLLGTYDLGLIVSNDDLDGSNKGESNKIPDFDDYLNLSKDDTKKTVEKVYSNE